MDHTTGWMFPAFILVNSEDVVVHNIGALCSLKEMSRVTKVECKGHVCLPVFSTEESARRFIQLYELEPQTILKLTDETECVSLFGSVIEGGCTRIILDAEGPDKPVNFANIERLHGEMRATVQLRTAGHN